MALLSNKPQFKSTAPAAGRPRAAVELAPEGALAASVAGAGVAPVYAFAPLRPGALSAGIAGVNIMTADAVTETLRSALDQVAPKNPSVTLIVPDTCARVFVLDFDSLPAKAVEVIPVLRFRLRKMVPFDVEHAAVSYQALSQDRSAAEGQVRVLVAVMPGPVLAEYEGAVRAAGYEPGAVLPSSIASLAALNLAEPALGANLSSLALTTFISSGNDLLLYRTVELPEDDAGRLAEVQRSVAVAAAYFEDKLGVRPRQLHYAGAVPAGDFARAVRDAELDVVEVAPTPATGATTIAGPIGYAGITGALTGAA